jgi:hypothetical protein
LDGSSFHLKGAIAMVNMTIVKGAIAMVNMAMVG